MNDTTILSTRLHDLADELTPRVDVSTQVGAARSRYRRQRRGRLAVIGTVAATLAVVGVPTAIGALSSAQSPHGQTARPGISTPTTSTASDQSSAEERATEAALAAARAAAERARTASDRSIAEERLKAAETAAGMPRTGG